MLLKDSEPYVIRIHEPVGVEVFCVFFERDTLEETAYNTARAPAHIVDNPDGRTTARRWLNQPVRHDTLVSPALGGFRAPYRVHADDARWIEESRVGLLTTIMRAHEARVSGMARIQAMRYSTREEIPP